MSRKKRMKRVLRDEDIMNIPREDVADVFREASLCSGTGMMSEEEALDQLSRGQIPQGDRFCPLKFE